MKKILCLLLFATNTQAAVYRCDLRGGLIRYQNFSCPGGAFQQKIRIETPPPPQFFMQPPVKEIPSRTPVRVIPVLGADGFFDSASSEQVQGEWR